MSNWPKMYLAWLPCRMQKIYVKGLRTRANWWMVVRIKYGSRRNTSAVICSRTAFPIVYVCFYQRALSFSILIRWSVFSRQREVMTRNPVELQQKVDDAFSLRSALSAREDATCLKKEIFLTNAKTTTKTACGFNYFWAICVPPICSWYQSLSEFYYL